MSDGTTEQRLRYREPPRDRRKVRYVALAPGLPDAPRYAFYSRLEIGRDDDSRSEEPGLLLVPDPTISRQHCVVTQQSNGRCFVRDVSRNGTRLDGRRLVPNVETEWRIGQGIAIGSHEFVLIGDAEDSLPPQDLSPSTVAQTSRCIVTVLVGDIRDYTVLVRQALSEDLQRSVSRVFEALSAGVLSHGGTVKEYQGDAILAYWEGDDTGQQALRACRGALALDETAQRIAADRSIWAIADFPLHLDWALSTGLVLIDSFGRGAGGGSGLQPAGLSMMGEPVVRAFRLEKFAKPETGRILACNMTRDLCKRAFAFHDLGEMTAKGFDRPDRVFALVGERASLSQPPREP